MTANDIVESLLMRKMMGERFVDFDPLVVVMAAIAEEIGEEKMRGDPVSRRIWLQAVSQLQESSSLEHNRFIPCRTCDVAFKPVIGDRLLDLFLALWPKHDTNDLLAIHRCVACGGSLEAIRSKKYVGDHFTPPPGTVSNDHAWASALLYGPSSESDES